MYGKHGHVVICTVYPFAVSYLAIRDLKIEVFRHFPRIANVKKSCDQCLAVRFAV